VSHQALTVFDFETSPVRVVDREGDPWFVLADVCRVLEIANSRNPTSRLDADEKDVHTMDTPGGRQQATVINESGLYSLILTSRKDSAKRFKKWATGTVLPSIRKHGGYVRGQEPYQGGWWK
jgi:prophage antirepressor-like protein